MHKRNYVIISLSLSLHSLSIQMSPEGGVEVENLVVIKVSDFQQVIRLYELGMRFRSTASTMVNSMSSRSHW